MSILHFRSIERRRTARVAMCMDVLAYGEDAQGENFKFWTRTLSVSAHGGVLVLAATLEVGQQFHLMNEYNLRKASARIVALRRGREGQVYGSFEFVHGGDRFWSMVFPAAGARPLRKIVPGSLG